MEPHALPPDYREKLEDFETQYGALAGKLALAMDLISDAEITAGQLALYCPNSLNPKQPHPDVQLLQRQVNAVRGLVKEAFREEQRRKEEARRK